jgi:hypothetical protein
MLSKRSCFKGGKKQCSPTKPKITGSLDFYLYATSNSSIVSFYTFERLNILNVKKAFIDA